MCEERASSVESSSKRIKASIIKQALKAKISSKALVPLIVKLKP